jgi:hypothetical protein
MKGCFGRRIPAAALSAALLFCLFPFFAAAQTEERVETGRFGAEERDPSQAAANENGYTNKWLYLGARLGPSVRFYTPSGDTPYTGGDTRAVSLDTAFQVSFLALPFLSFQGEMIFTWDTASGWDYLGTSNDEIDRYTWDHTAFSLQFPLMVKLNFYPGKFRISPFLGAYYLLPLGNLETTNSRTDEKQSVSYRVSPPFGLLGGLSAALKLGPGMIIADVRYSADLGEPESPDTEIKTYRRNMVSLTLGYEFGFFTKNRGAKHE